VPAIQIIDIDEQVIEMDIGSQKVVYMPKPESKHDNLMPPPSVNGNNTRIEISDAINTQIQRLITKGFRVLSMMSCPVAENYSVNGRKSDRNYLAIFLLIERIR